MTYDAASAKDGEIASCTVSKEMQKRFWKLLGSKITVNAPQNDKSTATGLSSPNRSTKTISSESVSAERQPQIQYRDRSKTKEIYAVLFKQLYEKRLESRRGYEIPKIVNVADRFKRPSPIRNSFFRLSENSEGGDGAARFRGWSSQYGMNVDDGENYVESAMRSLSRSNTRSTQSSEGRDTAMNRHTIHMMDEASENAVNVGKEKLVDDVQDRRRDDTSSPMKGEAVYRTVGDVPSTFIIDRLYSPGKPLESVPRLKIVHMYHRDAGFDVVFEVSSDTKWYVLKRVDQLLPMIKKISKDIVSSLCPDKLKLKKELIEVYCNSMLSNDLERMQMFIITGVVESYPARSDHLLMMGNEWLAVGAKVVNNSLVLYTGPKVFKIVNLKSSRICFHSGSSFEIVSSNGSVLFNTFKVEERDAWVEYIRQGCAFVN